MKYHLSRLDVVEATKGLALAVNHSNTISAGFEKDMVVSTLLALGCALANGWSGKQPERLVRYVEDIDAGKRQRCSRVLRADYGGDLRRRTAEGA